MTMTKAEDKKVAIQQKSIADRVAESLRGYQANHQIDLPPNYSAENAVKAAWLQISQTVDRAGKPALEVCTPASVAQALLDMVLQGLNPSKKQAYFIVYGNRLTCMRSYFGSAGIVQELTGSEPPWAEIVYEGDEFKYEITPRGKRIKSHVQNLENIRPDKIKAAYCIISWPEEAKKQDWCEIMTWQQIQKSWQKSQTFKPEDPRDNHNLFPEEFCKRTVINRACKALINSTSDKRLFLEAFNRADEEADEIAAEAAIEEGMAQTDVVEAPVAEVKAEVTQQPEMVAATQKKAPFLQ